MLFITIVFESQAIGRQIHWQAKSLVLIQKGATYARMIRLKNGDLLCVFEMDGKSWVKRSVDDGVRWGDRVLVASSPYGSDSNPSLIQLQNGSILLWYNFRPNDGIHSYEISYNVSNNGGVTWTAGKTVWAGGITAKRGCWEPAAVQLPSGEIELFFSMEAPFGMEGEQGIALERSYDEGKHWSHPDIISCNPGKRDGMPVPIISTSSGRIYVSIEANRETTNQLQPSVIWTTLTDDWHMGCIGRKNPFRISRIVHPSLPDTVYAGAPYLCELNQNTLILSCQIKEKHADSPRMMVYVADIKDMQFTNPSHPFYEGENPGCWWNSLFAKNQDTVTAISNTSVNGVRGIWAIDGTL